MDVSCFVCAGFAVESVRTISVGVNVSSVLQYGLVKHGTMWNIPHLWCIPNFALVTLKSHISLAI